VRIGDAPAPHRLEGHAWERLESALEKSGTADPVDVVALRDFDEQLSYAIKFVSYHRPGRRRVPLPRDRLVEVVGRDIATRTSCSPMAPVVAAADSSSTSSPRCFATWPLRPARLLRWSRLDLGPSGDARVDRAGRISMRLMRITVL
jgi:hypothetical protein